MQTRRVEALPQVAIHGRLGIPNVLKSELGLSEKEEEDGVTGAVSSEPHLNARIDGLGHALLNKNINNSSSPSTPNTNTVDAHTTSTFTAASNPLDSSTPAPNPLTSSAYQHRVREVLIIDERHSTWANSTSSVVFVLMMGSSLSARSIWTGIEVCGCIEDSLLGIAMGF